MRYCCVDDETINRPDVGMDLKQFQETNCSEKATESVSIPVIVHVWNATRWMGTSAGNKKKLVSASVSFHIIRLALILLLIGFRCRFYYHSLSVFVDVSQSSCSSMYLLQPPITLIWLYATSCATPKPRNWFRSGESGPDPDLGPKEWNVRKANNTFCINILSKVDICDLYLYFL